MPGPQVVPSRVGVPSGSYAGPNGVAYPNLVTAWQPAPVLFPRSRIVTAPAVAAGGSRVLPTQVASEVIGFNPAAATGSPVDFTQITVQVGDLITVGYNGEDNALTEAITNQAGTATTSTWTRVVGTNTASNSRVGYWAATATGAGTLTVRVTLTGTNPTTHHWGASLRQWRDSDGLGASFAGLVQTTTLVEQQDNSTVLVNVSDWNAVNPGTPTWNGGLTTVTSGRDTGAVHYAWALAKLDDAGAASSTNYGLATPTFGKPAMAVLEVLGKAAGGGAQNAAADLPVTATLTATAAVDRPATASLAATATLTEGAALTRPADASLAVTATLAAAATLSVDASASLAVTATLTAAATVTGTRVVAANGFEAGSVVGAVGVTVANSDDSGESAFTTVAAGSGGTVAYSQTDTLRGDWCGQFTQATAANQPVAVQLNQGGGATAFAARAYFRWTGLPGGDCTIIQPRTTADAQFGSVQLTSTGLLKVASPSGVNATGSVAVSVDTWYRVELYCSGLNGAAGEYHARIYDRHSTTALDSVDLTGLTTAGLVDRCRFGRMSAVSLPTWREDDVAFTAGDAAPIGASSGPEVFGAASLTATAGLTSAAALAVPAAASLPATATLTAAAAVTRPATAALTATAATSTNGTVTGAGSNASVTATAAINPAGATTTATTASRAAAATVTAAGSVGAPASATRTAAASIAAAATVSRAATAALNASAGISPTAAATAAAQASLTGAAAVSAAGVVGLAPVLAQASITATATVTSAATPVRTGAANPNGTATITATAAAARPAGASLAGLVTISATATTAASASATRPTLATVTATADVAVPFTAGVLAAATVATAGFAVATAATAELAPTTAPAAVLTASSSRGGPS